MPQLRDQTALPRNAEPSDMPLSLANGFPEAPKDDIKDLRDRSANKSALKLEIVSAVLGVVDCTDGLREMINPDQTLVVQTEKMSDMLASQSSQPGELRFPSLSFIFRYTDQPLRIAVTGTTNVPQSFAVTPTSTEYPVLEPTEWTNDTWSVAAIVYGARYFADGLTVTAFLGEIKNNFAGGKGRRAVQFRNSLFPSVSILRDSHRDF